MTTERQLEVGRDASVVLSSGRVLEYWDGGDPGGRPVIYHPGTPVTRVLGAGPTVPRSTLGRGSSP